MAYPRHRNAQEGASVCNNISALKKKLPSFSILAKVILRISEVELNCNSVLWIYIWGRKSVSRISCVLYPVAGWEYPQYYIAAFWNNYPIFSKSWGTKPIFLSFQAATWERHPARQIRSTKSNSYRKRNLTFLEAFLEFCITVELFH